MLDSDFSKEELEKIIKLPEHLQRTYKALLQLNTATATKISSVTKFSRALESNYLNQLVVIGYATKSRLGRQAIFKEREK